MTAYPIFEVMSSAVMAGCGHEAYIKIIAPAGMRGVLARAEASRAFARAAHFHPTSTAQMAG